LTILLFGRAFPQFGSDMIAFAEMFAAIAVAAVRIFRHPRRFRLASAVHHLDRVGWHAMPIMLRLSGR
jgi:phospholipid/cholesterol/gamma-HCH transport system permease protein